MKLFGHNTSTIVLFIIRIAKNQRHLEIKIKNQGVAYLERIL